MKKIETSQSFYCFRKTAFGPLAVLWSVYQGQPNILRILLSRPIFSARQFPGISSPGFSSSSCVEIDSVADRIMAFLAGEGIRFFWISFEWINVPDFSKRCYVQNMEFLVDM